MPLVRYEIRNEYSLANPDLYRTASKDDPQGMLEGVCMAGLVGIVRQLGDLAEFAAEVFHDLHEELMTTAARGHGLMIRVQQLEAEFPLIEKDLLTRNDQLRFAYTPGVDWHASIRTEQNHLTQGDLPRFILNSYEECRGPPRLFLLDKFDVAGAGACLKRYTDPSFFKMEWASSELMKAEKIQKEKKARKKKGRRRRNGEAAEVAPANARVRYSSLDLDQPMYKQKIYVNTGPQKLKLKQSYSLLYLNEEDGNSSLQVPYETFGSPKPIETGPLGSLSLSNAMNVKSDSDSSLRFPSEKQVTAGRQTKVSFDSSCHEHTRNDTYDQKKTELATPKEFYKDDTTDNLSNVSDADLYKASSYVSVHQKTTWSQQDVSDGNIAMDGKKEAEIAGSKFENDDAASEADNYMDALATIESEIDTDSEGRTKHEDHNTLNHETSVVSSKMSSMHSRFIDAEAGSFYNGESSDESSKVDHFSKKYLDDPSSIEFAAYDVPLKRYPPDTSLEQSPGSVLIPIESSSDKSTDALNVESSEQKNSGPIDLADIRNVTSTFNKNHIPSITRGPSTAEEFEDVTKEIQMPAEVPANKETLNTNEILAGHGADIKNTAADEPVIVSKALQEDVGIKEPQTTMSKLDESSFGRAAPDELRSILLDIHASETTTHDNMGIADSSLVCRESPANISSPMTDRELSVESAVVKEDVCAIKHEQDFEYERPGSGEGLEASQTILNIDTHLDASISAHDDEHISVSQKTNVEGLKMEESVSRLQDSDLDQSLESPTLDMADSYQNKGITSVEDENIWKAEDIPIKDLHVQSEQIVTSGDSVDDVFEKRVSEESTIARPGNVIDVEVPAPAEDSHSIKPSLSSGSFKSIFDIRPRAEHIGTSSEVFSTSSSNLTSERGSKNSNELDTQLLSVIRPVKPAGADLPEEPVVDVPAKEEVEGEPPSPTIEFIKITFQSGPESPLSLSSTSSENLQEQHHQIDQQIRSCPPLQEEGRSTAINEDFEHRSIDEFGITSRQFSHRLSDSSEEIAVYSGRIVLSDEEDTGSPGASSTSSLSSLGSPRAKDHSFLNLKCSSPETKPSRSPSQSPNISLGSSPRSLRSSRPHSPVPQKEPHQSSTRSSATIIPEISASEQSTDTDAKMLPTPPPLPPADWGKSSIHHGTSLPGSVQVHPPVPPPPPPPQLNFDNGRLNISTSDLASKMQKNAPQRNDSLIEEITSHDKSTLKKVSNQAPNTSKSQDNREVLLEQIRSQSFNLRRTPVTKPTISRPVTNINVAAILEKANAIRQAYEGSDEEGEDDDWSDT